jgi:hypothetical protein
MSSSKETPVGAAPMWMDRQEAAQEGKEERTGRSGDKGKDEGRPSHPRARMSCEEE